MPETDAVEKLLAEQKAIEDRRKQLIEDLLKQKADAMKDFDEKLAKLGYHGDGAGKSKRNHHKKAEGGSAKKSSPKA